MKITACRPEHVAATQLVWRIARRLSARDWVLSTTEVSRRWHTREWRAQAYVSFFFEPSRRGPASVFAVGFEGRIPKDIRAQLSEYEDVSRSRIIRGFRGESRPRILLAELDRIASVFGSNDRHRVEVTRSTLPEKRLWAIARSVLAHGAWSVETPTMTNWRSIEPRLMSASISPMPWNYEKRPQIAAWLFARNRRVPNELVRRIELAGYENHDGKAAYAWCKRAPLSVRTALADARFLEAACR